MKPLDGPGRLERGFREESPHGPASHFGNRAEGEHDFRSPQKGVDGNPLRRCGEVGHLDLTADLVADRRRVAGPGDIPAIRTPPSSARA